MFEAVIERASLLKKIIDAVKELSKEVCLVCDEKGIKLRVMDSSHVSLTDLHMAEAAFLDYRRDSRKVLGMNLEHMKKIFTLCNNEDKVTMKCEDDGSHLLFTFEAMDERVSWARISDLRILEFEQDFRRGSKFPNFSEGPSESVPNYERLVLGHIDADFCKYYRVVNTKYLLELGKALHEMYKLHTFL